MRGRQIFIYLKTFLIMINPYICICNTKGCPITFRDHWIISYEQKKY
jgi:hypothetical protein